MVMRVADETHNDDRRRRIAQLPDSQLANAVAAKVAVPRVAPADSFVLHAPLELLARAELLRHVDLPDRDAAREKLFALTTAAVTLDVELGLRTAGVAAVVFKSMSSSDFVRAENEIQELLDAVASDSGSRLERKEDTYGFEWIVVRDSALEDQVTAVHAVSSELVARGFGEQLLAAVFRFDGGNHPVYWIYGFKRGAFWPFVPTGEEQQRDNAEELELKAKLGEELPIEPDLSRWFALFDVPI
jgi:hypothetical protein